LNVFIASTDIKNVEFGQFMVGSAH
jgi:hypothetical protein